MPSSKKSDKSAADTDVVSAAASSTADTDKDAVIDLMDALEVGTPGLDPVSAKFRGVRFRINRHYSPTTIWEWSDLQRKNAAASAAEDAAAVGETNRELMQVIVDERDHDRIDELLDLIGDRSLPEAKRIFAYLFNVAGLTDKWGNPLAL